MKKPSKKEIILVAILPITAMFCLLAFGAGAYSFLIAFLLTFVGESIIARQNKKTTAVL
jgi:hypothetical protein